MTEPEVLETRAKGRDSSAGLGGFIHFDRRTQREAFDGLSRASLIYAVVYALAYTTGWVTHRPLGQIHHPPLESIVIAVLAVAGALAVSWFTARHRIPVNLFGATGMGFGILGSLGIAAAQWEWRPFLEAQGVAFYGVHWIGIWILMFPTMLVLTPRQVLVSGLVGMLTIPAHMALTLAGEGLPVTDGEPSLDPVWGALGQFLAPIAICLGISVALSSRVFNLTRDVSRARQMGNYRLDHRIGKGGMGEVWAARHRLLARPAAIKIIRGEGEGGTSGRTGVKRFEREAQATAALTSPHTISVFDFGTTDDGAFYYVMELLEGMNLRELVERTGPVPQSRAIHFLRQACASLADAHRHGLVHRDVKPANLFICRRGLLYDFTKVLDFGLVKDATPQSDVTQLTTEGATSGTPAFMAPEMITGHPDIDARADLYGLGCVAYWLLCGHLVFDARSPVAMAVKHAQDSPERPSTRTENPIDPELERLVLDCLAKDRGRRPASAVELDRRLEQVEERTGAWGQERAERWWRTHLPRLAAVDAPSPVAITG